MISISKLLCELDAEGDGLRYDDGRDSSREQITEDRTTKPVVVWNVTRRCNLYCEHCYAGADLDAAPGELTTAEGKRLLDELADYGVPVVLFSGGEPLVRDDLETLVAHAADVGIRPVLSTNGTLVTPDRAAALRDAGLKYAGVSVDGMPERNDAFRGEEGAFDAAVRGIEQFLDAGLKTGLRYTITEKNAADMESVVNLLSEVGVDRFCFYHLDYGGRGGDIADADLTPDARREAVERLCELTLSYHDAGEEIETLLVGNYCDAAWSTHASGSARGRPPRFAGTSRSTAAIRRASGSRTSTTRATSTPHSSGRATASATSATARSARSGRTTRTRCCRRFETGRNI